MIEVVIDLEGQKSHKPHYRLIQLIARRSYFEQRKEDLDMRGESEITNEEKEELEFVNDKLRSMRNEKKEILNDFVFPSMANILFFFKALAEDEDFNTESKNKKNFHLREVFRDDIKELLGIKRLNPKSDNYAFVFTSLLLSIYKSYYPTTSLITLLQVTI